MNPAFLNSVFCGMNPPGALGTSAGLQPLAGSETLDINLLNILVQRIKIISLWRIAHWLKYRSARFDSRTAPNEDSGHGASFTKKHCRGMRYWMDGLSCKCVKKEKK